MRKRTLRTVMAAATAGVFLGLSGCGTSKQKASAALDEARFAVSSAKSIDTQVYAGDTLKAAQSAFKKAEKEFKAMRYGLAKTFAENATRLAKQSRSEAKKTTSKKRQGRNKTGIDAAKSKKKK